MARGTRRSALMVLLTAALSSAAAARGVAPDDAEEELVVVTVDGRLEVGRLEFVGPSFRVVAAGGQEGRRGGSKTGRRGEVAGRGRLRADLAPLLALTDPDRFLAEIDRIEAPGGRLLFQARPYVATGPQVDGARYVDGYGGLSFRLVDPAHWSFARVEEAGAVCVRRKEDGEIVGIVRVSVHRAGDGVTLERRLEADLQATPQRLEALARRRFDPISARRAEDRETGDGLVWRCLVYRGTERGTGEPLLHEVWLLKQGPFLPRVDIVARGEETLAEAAAEARAIVETLDLDRAHPAPRRPRGQGRMDRGRGGRDAAPEVRIASADPAVVAKGRYASPLIGLRFRRGLPKEWTFAAAEPRGMAAMWSPLKETAEVAVVAVSALRGAWRGDDPEGFFLEHAEFQGTDVGRVRHVRFGGSKAAFVEVEGSTGRLGLVERVFVAPTEDSVVVLFEGALATGSGADDLLEPLGRLVRSLVLED